MLTDLLYFLSHGYSVEKNFDPETYFSDDQSSVLAEPPSQYGKKESNSSFAEKLKRRTKLASIEIINLMEDTNSSPAINVIRYQLIKSATSTAANYRAACRARSTREFYAKLCIVVEECDETLFWMETLIESKVKIDKQAVKSLMPEWDSILKIVVSARKSAGLKLKKSTP